MEGSKIIARDTFFEEILEDLLDFNKDHGTSLYICGKPGTGKTFTVDRVLEEIKKRRHYMRKFHKIIEFNGMEVSKSSDIWKILHKSLELSRNKSLQNSIYEYFDSLTKPLIIVIDEFENLITKCNKELIADLFALPYNYDKVILISISNLVDLPDILMPQLERRGCVPNIIIFPPYNKSEILQIIQELYGDCSDSIALEICAAQVEKIGDARRALGICKNSMKNGKISLNSTIESTTNWHTAIKALSDLPYLNKGAVVICKKLAENKMNTTQLHSAYKTICSKEGGEGLPLKEFVDMMQNLSSCGIVELEGQAKNVLKLYPKILVSWSELEKAFKDLPEILELATLPVYSSWKYSS
ncbi:hypothetical protein SteCoe_18229 [Stentor coeruleus]|uniref:AAA+ ATPase domain-containing protein n=1 Tax=Stentor coeruleus TaxID=5963 RepID=A0A1R2BXI4_9CILI|nr:hypothetical protein SteCoe_18229 [Stentor coeruleus]